MSFHLCQYYFLQYVSFPIILPFSLTLQFPLVSCLSDCEPLANCSVCLFVVGFNTTALWETLGTFFHYDLPLLHMSQVLLTTIEQDCYIMSFKSSVTQDDKNTEHLDTTVYSPILSFTGTPRLHGLPAWYSVQVRRWLEVFSG